jgi:hypothetical protein
MVCPRPPTKPRDTAAVAFKRWWHCTLRHQRLWNPHPLPQPHTRPGFSLKEARDDPTPPNTTHTLIKATVSPADGFLPFPHPLHHATQDDRGPKGEVMKACLPGLLRLHHDHQLSVMTGSMGRDCFNTEQWPRGQGTFAARRQTPVRWQYARYSGLNVRLPGTS